MILTSFGGKLEQRLLTANYTSWPGAAGSGLGVTVLAGVVGEPRKFDQAFKKEDMVYLTAESVRAGRVGQTGDAGHNAGCCGSQQSLPDRSDSGPEPAQGS